MNPISFELGRIAITHGIAAMIESGELPSEALNIFLGRHIDCDWGDVPPEDAELNDAATKDGGRVLSAYLISDNDPLNKIWIITEADRSHTTILLPSEY